MSDYRVTYYKNSHTGKEPVHKYIHNLRPKEQYKIFKHLELLRVNDGKLPIPYCKHIEGKIWELRVQFSPHKHRIMYVTVADKIIILLHAFTKKTEKLPLEELEKARKNLEDTLLNLNSYHEN